MFKLHLDQINDFHNMASKACWIDHEHFMEMPLIPRAGNLEELVVVDGKEEVTARVTVRIYETTSHSVLMERCEGINLYNW